MLSKNSLEPLMLNYNISLSKQTRINNFPNYIGFYWLDGKILLKETTILVFLVQKLTNLHIWTGTTLVM